MSQKNTIMVTFPDGTKQDYPQGITLLEISKEKQHLHKTPIVVAKVDWNLRELNYALEKDCSVQLIDLSNQEGIRVYQRSLIFVLIKATKDLFPERQLQIEHSLGRGLYCELNGERPLAKDEVEQIKYRMEEIVKANLPIYKKKVLKDEAKDIFERSKEYGKVNLLRYRKEEDINMYTLDDYDNYFFGYMVPNTGVLQIFDLNFYLPGMVLLKPTIDSPHQVASFVEQKKLFSAYREAEKWGEIIEIPDVAALNESIETGKIDELIRVAEAKHEKKISRISDVIYENRDHIRVILIAGPSSSGKTTLSRRLSTHLRTHGLKPIAISLDDYFVDRENTPLDANGDYDFESIDAIDIELFNDHLVKLIQGEEVDVPFFNFMNGKREYRGRVLKLTEDNPIIIEGIHGLNEKLTADIPQENKFKIYISALTQLNVDQHNRIPTTDNRLIRRLVRDNKYRNHDALSTLQLWPSVRRGEEKNIFPYQEEADIMFNSALFYEMSVLKKYAEPLLNGIPTESPYYSEAKRLLKFLKYFVAIEDESSIMQNSILKEFIGGNIYHK